MKQPSLLDKPVTIIDIPPEPQPTGLSVVEPQPAALKDFRTGFMLMPRQLMEDALSEYKDRREGFRAWLLANLVEGVHFGYAPGCAPKYILADGRPCDKASAWGTLGYKGAKIPLTEWQPKPSLYAAGADLMCDLMWVRDEYEADLGTWQQLGSQAGHIIRKCKLYSRATNEFLGEGTGGRQNGQKGGDLNNSVKMCDKSAKVAACLNTWGLRDLFTQDEPPDNNPPLRPGADANPNAPQAQPRGYRVTKEQIDALGKRWKKCEHPDKQKKTDWERYVAETTKREFNVWDANAWTASDVVEMDMALKARDA